MADILAAVVDRGVEDIKEGRRSRAQVESDKRVQGLRHYKLLVLIDIE